MDKRIKWGIVALIGIGLIGLAVHTFVPRTNDELAEVEQQKPTATKRTTLNVNAQIIKPHLLTDKLFVSGKLIPDEEVDLSFETSGKIVDIFFTEGTFVSKGQLLAKVNDRQLQAHVKASIELTELRAPFDGVIGLRQVSTGAYASPSVVVAKLTRITPLKVEFAVPERYARQIRKGANLSFKVEGKLDAYQAQVYATESSIDPSTHTLNVRAIYPNKQGELLPGRYASIELSQNEIKDAIAIPSEAIVPEMGQNKVFVYRNGLAQPVDVDRFCADWPSVIPS